MKIIYLIALLILSILGISETIANKKNKLRKRILLIIVISFATIYIFFYQETEKNNDERKQKENQIYSEIRAEQRTQEISKKIEESKEKEKEGLFTEKDYLNRIALELEKLNLNVKGYKIIEEPYITTYFIAVEKIPQFYTLEEWRETEKDFFIKMIDGLKNNFSARGMYDSGLRERAEKDFAKEREKYIKAKERTFKGVLGEK